MAAIESLCDRCILLDSGRVATDGPADAVIAAYQAAGAGACADWVDLSKHTGRRTGSIPLMKRAALLDESGAMTSSIRMGSSLSVQVEFESPDKPLRPFLGLSIKTFIGARVMGIDNRIVPGFVFDPVGRGRITCRLDRVPFMPGNYVIDLYLGDENLSHDAVFDAVSFEVAPADVFGSGKLPPPASGPIHWPAKWSLLDSQEREIPPVK
jgi:lipopolysaccharide transport system ATP-binding protein